MCNETMSDRKQLPVHSGDLEKSLAALPASALLPVAVARYIDGEACHRQLAA